MDPNNLDPKLKATYDRVMGTQTLPTNQPTQPTPQTPPLPTAVNPVIATAQPGASPTPTTAYTADNLSFQAAIQTPGIPLAQPGQQAIPQQPSTVIKFLYIVGAIVFFAVYTFVWVKIFNLPLPF